MVINGINNEVKSFLGRETLSGEFENNLNVFNMLNAWCLVRKRHQRFDYINIYVDTFVMIFLRRAFETLWCEVLQKKLIINILIKIFSSTLPISTLVNTSNFYKTKQNRGRKTPSESPHKISIIWSKTRSQISSLLFSNLRIEENFSSFPTRKKKFPMNF